MGRRLVSSCEAVATPVQHTSPCSYCPWSRESLNGMLGGVSKEEWLRRAHSETPVPCHVAANQCAGIAIYRQNVLRVSWSPLPSLSAEKSRVFSTPSEFLDHHRAPFLLDGLAWQIRQFFRRSDSLAILDASGIEGTFQAGGCLIAAKALLRHFKSLGFRASLVAVRGKSTVDGKLVQQHVVVKVRDGYVDSDGLHTAADLIRIFTYRERLRDVDLAPFAPRKAGEIRTNRIAVNRLYRSLVRAIGAPARQR